MKPALNSLSLAVAAAALILISSCGVVEKYRHAKARYTPHHKMVKADRQWEETAAPVRAAGEPGAVPDPVSASLPAAPFAVAERRPAFTAEQTTSGMPAVQQAKATGEHTSSVRIKRRAAVRLVRELSAGEGIAAVNQASWDENSLLYALLVLVLILILLSILRVWILADLLGLLIAILVVLLILKLLKVI